MSSLSLSLLGSLDISLDGQPVKFRSRKAEALLIYLSTEATFHPTTTSRRETLQALLWPGYQGRSARQSLRTVLSYLRKAFPSIGTNNGDSKAPFLLSDKQIVQINPAVTYDLDVATFTRLLRDVERHEHEGLMECAGCLEWLQQATALYRGDFLTDFYLADSSQFETWVASRREELRRRALEALEKLTAIHLAHAKFDKAETLARRQLEVDNLLESAHRQLMEILARMGRRRAALTHYETVCQLLQDNLGIEPSAETQILYEVITEGEFDKPSGVQKGSGEVAPMPTTPLPDTPAHLPAFLKPSSDVAEVERDVFVARERELAQLDKHFEAALSGRGSIVFITGEAGQGKTTLLREFARRTQESRARLIVASGNCTAYAGVGDPYLAFREVMVMLSGDVEAQLAAGAITRDHAQRLWRLLPVTAQALIESGPDLIDVFVRGSALVGRAAAAFPGRSVWLDRLQEMTASRRTGSTDLEQRYLFEQYASVLYALAAQHPLLITLDDLQWADAASISLLFHLGQRVAGSPILIVGTYRPDEVALGMGGKRHPLEKMLAELKLKFGDIWVALGQGEEAEGRGFVDVLLDAQSNRLGEGFRQSLFQRTGGHPLFTVELLREMQARGDLVQNKEGDWIEGSASNWQTLPARVEGVLEERIGRLNPELLEILSVASVEGENFTAEVMARVQGISQRQLLGYLSRELNIRHRLIREREEVNAGQQSLSRYQFSHILFQRYLYDNLSSGERRLLHGEIAQALEALYEGQAGEIANQLAHHYLKAGEREKGIEYSRLAAQRAKAAYAYDEAIHHLQNALDLLETGEQSETRLELLEELADVHIVFTTDTQAISYYQTALEQWSSLPGADKIIAVRLHRKILEFASFLRGIADLEVYDPLSQTLATSQDFLEASLPLDEREQSQLEMVRVLTSLANDSDYSGRSPSALDKAEGYTRAAVDLVEQLDAPVEMSDVLGTLADIYFERGLLHEQLEVSRRRLALSQDPRFSDILKRGHILADHSSALIAIGEYDQALPFLLELGNLTMLIGAITVHIWTLGLRALCLFRLDRWEEIFRIEENRRELERRHSSDQLGGGTCVVLSLSAAAHALQGDLNQARVLREQAYAFMVRSEGGIPDNWGRSQYY
ncbi:MAG: AAA family ATPase [Candidatus Promineifilaceae bacterium]